MTSKYSPSLNLKTHDLCPMNQRLLYLNKQHCVYFELSVYGFTYLLKCCSGQAVQPLHNKVTFMILCPIGQCWPLYGIQKNPCIFHRLPMGDKPRFLWIQVTQYARGDQRGARQLQWLCIQGHECTGVERSCRKLFTLDLFESIAAVLWFFSMICNLSLFGSS